MSAPLAAKTLQRTQNTNFVPSKAAKRTAESIFLSYIKISKCNDGRWKVICQRENPKRQNSAFPVRFFHSSRFIRCVLVFPWFWNGPEWSFTTISSQLTPDDPRALRKKLCQGENESAHKVFRSILCIRPGRWQSKERKLSTTALQSTAATEDGNSSSVLYSSRTLAQLFAVRFDSVAHFSRVQERSIDHVAAQNARVWFRFISFFAAISPQTVKRPVMPVKTHYCSSPICVICNCLLTFFQHPSHI